MKSANGDTFIRVTNRDIYTKLESIEKRIGKINIKANVNSALIGLIILVGCALIAQVFN